MSDLVKNNVQSDILKLKHFMKKNLKENNINQLVSFLDNITSGSNLVKDIYIINSRGKLIYSTDRTTNLPYGKKECISIAKINSADVFGQKCYSFGVRLYNGLDPYYYHSYVHIDKRYLKTLLVEKIERYGLHFLLFFMIFNILMWILLKKVLINPLEKLRQFAYYNTKIPHNLLIRELESIRHSLAFTFDRLKREQEELYKLSTKDSLSGLYNRLSLMEKLNWFISKNRRSKGRFAIIFLDLDNFKNINDTKGHDIGDKVLKHISKILLNAMRENDIVSRIGGDEFVVVLPDFEDDMAVVEVVQRIKTSLLEPINLDNTVYNITASMGITIYPKDGEDTTTLLKNADIAMYKAKEMGKNSYHFFTDSLNKRIQEKVHIQKLMSNALENGYFKLFYQPKVDIKTSKIVSCEALIRLVDPQEGILSPDKFIPLAEESNFIIPLGEWIINEAVSELKKWENTALKNLKISINISAVQFRDKRLLEIIKKSIKNIDPSSLDIELTESVLMSDFNENIKIINKIKELGITLSLDDFGTGYSSLSYLKTIPFDTIKIDKSFIDDIEHSKQEKLFINMIINIANELGLSVVAEGVETKEQLEYLRNMGCEMYQGFLCSKPLPEEEFEKLFMLHNGPIKDI
ncbi:MAG: EAL domain-containing protein [Sulfurospirillum sp.]